MAKINVKGTSITVYSKGDKDFISLTDMLRAKEGDFFISDWLRNRNTVEFLGIWEQVHNPDFNYGGFAAIKSQAGLNNYKLSVKEWVAQTNAVGLVAKAGRYGGTYAHKDIAFEFGMWISAEFKIYLIKEFQRLKETERGQLGWDIRRNLSKINYRIHTDANLENAVKDLVSFLPVLAYDGANMTQIDAGGILDIAMAGTSATLLARKWESALLVNVDNDTLRRILDNPEAMAAVERIEGWRSLGDHIIETIINKSEKVKELKNKAKDRDLTEKQKKQLTEEEKEYKSKRKLVQEKLIKFATRIPAFMYLTDFRENTLQDVITKLEPELFLTVTGLTVKDFHLLVRLKVFNTEQMNQAVFAFRRYEDASLRYTGIDSHPGLTHYGLYDTVVAREDTLSYETAG